MDHHKPVPVVERSFAEIGGKKIGRYHPVPWRETNAGYRNADRDRENNV